ncbi:hypothetical protein JXA47_12045 [Candidatus Sumerlaeota bacterium]|nr:hypothetical protein [Candidatus Sumerlaeota bacterium]
MTSSPPDPQPPGSPEARSRDPLLHPLLWAMWGLSVLAVAVAAMDWWGVRGESHWLSALTLKSLEMGGGWGVDLLYLRNAAPSPLGPLLGRLLVMLMPSVPVVLWSLSVAGAGLFALGLLANPWMAERRLGILVGIWGLLLWMSHPLLLSSMGSDWPLALGCLGLGTMLLEVRRERLGWLMLGLAVLGRAEMAIGLVGAWLWAWRRRRTGLIGWWVLGVIPPLLWGLGVWVAFGKFWPLTWASAVTMSQSGRFGPEAEYWVFLREALLTGHGVWIAALLALAVVGLLAIRQATVTAWAFCLMGLGCLAIHGSLHLAAGQWWWLLLGPFAALLLLAATGLGWLLEPDRPVMTRVIGIALALGAIGAQWSGQWSIRDWTQLREQSVAWDEAGSWLRHHIHRVSRIATTQPATVIWHLGIVHRLAVHDVHGLEGPLASGEPGEDAMARIEALEPDYLMLRSDEDETIINALLSDAAICRRWEHLHRVEGPGSWRIEIFGRRSGDMEPPLPPPAGGDPAQVEAVNTLMSESLRTGQGWSSAESTQITAGAEGLLMSDAGGGVSLWSPEFTLSTESVEALELTLNVDVDTPLKQIRLRILWEGDGMDPHGHGFRTQERRTLLVANGRPSGYVTLRVPLASNPLWRGFTTVSRLGLEPVPWPFEITLTSLRFVPAEVP